jgi:hypothetical protein
MDYHLSSLSGKIFFVKMHKKVNENLCILPIDEKTARDARTRAAKKDALKF